MTTNAESHPRRKTINVPKHWLFSKRWRDPSYSNRSFNAGRRKAREEYTPALPQSHPSQMERDADPQITQQGPSLARSRCLALRRYLELSSDAVDSYANEVMSCT